MSLRKYLSICAIFRNEAEYLKEWIEFHRLVGIEHFFLYNSFSEDAYLQILGDYISQGLVTLKDWPMPFCRGGQKEAYKHCLDHYKEKSQWIAFIDVDEFFFPTKANKLIEVLKDFEGFPGIVVNWQVYGSSGHVKTPGGLVIENFTMRARSTWVRNRRVKSIVDPTKAIRPVGPHFFEYLDDRLAVTENYEPVHIIKSRESPQKLKPFTKRIMPKIPLDPYAVNHSSVQRVSVSKLRINHYIVKSKEEYLKKIRRHESPINEHTRVNIYKTNHFLYHDRNEVRDIVLFRYLSPLKDAIWHGSFS
jgi:hypothetical protein